ncbi:MAG: hypothetical protein SFV52_10910 [Saprospiraceae bacterium]|nr:hypothetical protein [Saprospiraceae bacterium]
MRTLPALFVFTLLIAACKNDAPAGTDKETGVTYAEKNPLQLAGQWINIDFCSRANQYGSVLQTQQNSHKPYAYAYEFFPAITDSVVCYDGEKAWTLPVSIKADTVEVIGAHEGKSVYLVYNSAGQKDITVFDATSGRVKMDRYIKSNAQARNGNGAFAIALNHQLFNGFMIPAGSKDTVRFTAGGGILNWAPYDRFRVCAGGSCLYAGNDADIILLSNSKKEEPEKPFAFRYNVQRDSLYLYNIKPVEGGQAPVGSVAYRFRRQPAM